MKRILVVDDEQDILTAIADVLSEEGYEVATARNGAEALTLIDPVPDVVLVDVMMPVMDGRQFLLALRARPQTASIPCVVMSAGNPEALARELGCDSLRKPFDLNLLLRLLAERVDSRPR